MITMERKERSIVKSLSWRVIAFATTIAVAFVWLGNWEQSFFLGAVANGIKTAFYYGHERFWNRIDWGMI